MGNSLGVVDDESPFGLFLKFASPACAIILYLSPLPVMKDIWTNKSTKELTIAPYVSMFMMCSMWIGYAIVANEVAILYSGIPGTILGAIYSFYFINFAIRPKELRKYYATTLGHLLIMALLLFFPMDKEVRIYLLSIAAVTMRIIFLASPFMTVSKVLKTKSVESLPFGLSFVFLINGILWTSYGWFVVEDFVIIISQGLAIIMSSFQLLLHALYGDFFACFRNSENESVNSTGTDLHKDHIHTDEIKEDITKALNEVALA